MNAMKIKKVEWKKSVMDGTSKVCDMEVEAGGVEGAIVGVAIGGFEITRGAVEVGGVPEAAAKVGKKRELRP